MYKKYWVSLILITLCSQNIESSIYNYIYPHTGHSYSNYGGIGLIQNPTARFQDEGSLSFSWSHNEPYLRGSIVAYPFNWLETSFQYTDINNLLYSQNSEFSGSQSFKDKSFDTKFKIVKESKLIPQIAIGFRDIGGTGLFASEYLVFNKYIARNIDLSIGIGWGNLNNHRFSNPLKKISDEFAYRDQDLGYGGKLNINNLFSGDAGYFGGIEIFFPYFNGLRGKVELDGTNYNSEGAIPLKQDSDFNYGFFYPIGKNFDLKLSYTRGNTINFGFSYSLNLAKKNPRNMSKTPKYEVVRPDIVKTITSRSDENIYRASMLYLGRGEINLQKASIINDEELHIVYAQSKFRSPSMSIGRALNIVNDIAPDKIKKLRVSEINGGLGIHSASIDRDTFERYQKFKSAAPINHYIEVDGFKFNEKEYLYNPLSDYPSLFYNLGPDIRSQIGGPDGFFFGDLKLTLDSEILLRRKLSLVSTFSYGLYDNMDKLKLPSDSILPHVRTEIVQYLKESRNFSIRNLYLNYYDQISKSLYFKLSGGLLESMFSGIGFELLYRPYFNNYGIGIELWNVNQREYDQMFGHLDYRTLTGHTTFYYKEPSSGILLQLKAGKYLAKDSGFTLDLSREFYSGLRVGAFFSLTDISSEEFGEGSFDKGFYFWIPLEVFSGEYFKRNFGWGLRPITRDGAQFINHGYPLWGVTDNVNSSKFRNKIHDFFD